MQSPWTTQPHPLAFPASSKILDLILAIYIFQGYCPFSKILQFICRDLYVVVPYKSFISSPCLPYSVPHA